MTSPASPLPPTSPDGAGASCGPHVRQRDYQYVVQWLPACGDPAIDRAACDPEHRPACSACGSGRLEQSDTSDHPGVVRCDACGLVQYV